MLKLNKIIRKTRLLTPPGFGLQVQDLEYRDDPLTGSRTILNANRLVRPRQTAAEDDISGFIESTRQGCVFCPENREKNTPMLVKEISGKGRMVLNGSFLFPNLFPFAEYHAVAVLSDEHFVAANRFTPECITDNLAVCREYAHAVYKNDRDARYPIWLWNYMPPSAGTIIHPHAQILIDREPMPNQKVLLRACDEYVRENGVSFWDGLIELERGGPRWIGEDDMLAVMATFAPRGNREVHFVFKNATCIAELNERQSDSFARALVNILHYYDDDGVNSFSLATQSAGIGEQANGYRLSVKVMSRPRFKPYYTAFGGPLEYWHGASVVETMPESVAERAREFFS
jgi:UDPglucose--hexose-1-phosphate uridylyltransferase